MGQEQPIRNNFQRQQINTYQPNQRTGRYIHELFGDAPSRANRRQYAPIYIRQRRPDDDPGPNEQ